MSLSSEMNLMDLLFEKEDPSLSLEGLDRDDLSLKSEFIDINSKPSFAISSAPWPSNPDDFLDFLSLDGNPFDESLLAENEISMDVSTASTGSQSPPTAVVSSSSSDSGVNSDVYSDVYSEVYSDQAVHDGAEDSGTSVDLQMSPNMHESEEDLSSLHSMPASPDFDTKTLDTSQLGVLDSAVLSAGILDTGSFELKNNTAIINMNLVPPSSQTVPQQQPQHSDLTAQQLTLRPVKNWKRSGTSGTANGRQMIRVTPMPAAGSLASHPRSILLPLQDLKDVRTIKIVNTTSTTSKRARCRPVIPALGKGTPVTLLQVKSGTIVNSTSAAPAQSASISSSINDILHMSGDDSSDDSSDATSHGQQQYPRVVLSPEEKRLMEKEGVTLPTHYPLTKQEERELKRIRRKIRNKISAQDSRKRKKEYVDGLEDRVRQCTDENRELLKRLKVLQSQNESLASQLQRLRTMVARGMAGSGSRAAQPATCLMVLLLSLALVMVPNLRPGNSTMEEQELSSASAGLSPNTNKLPALPGRSRTLLHSTMGTPLFAADSTDDVDLLDEEDLKPALPIMGKRRAHASSGSSLLDHDYSPSLKRGRFALDPGIPLHHFIEPAVDDKWPPVPQQKEATLPLDDRLETMMEQLLNNKTDKPPSTLLLPVSQEGR